MCFSATASFESAAFLVSVGTATTLRSRLPSEKMLAAMPLLFGVQQAAEGIIWLSLRHDVSIMVRQAAITAFIFIAVVLWPSWVPWSIFRMERERGRRKTLFALCGIGAFDSIYAVTVLFAGSPSAQISQRCIGYSFPQEAMGFIPHDLHLFLYFPAAILPFFLSSVRTVRTMGALLSIALTLTLVVRENAVTSVWCFFAALISLFIVRVSFTPKHY